MKKMKTKPLGAALALSLLLAAPAYAADYDFKGVNQFAYWYDAKAKLERGILTTNMMDDAGEENLRFFKEHLYPLVMLKK